MQELPLAAYAPYMETSSKNRQEEELQVNFENHPRNKAALDQHEKSYISKSGTKPNRSSFYQPVVTISETGIAPRSQGR